MNYWKRWSKKVCLNKQAAPRPNLPDRYFWLADQYPAGGISLRTGTADTIVILDQTETRARSIGQIDRDSASTLVHEGAIYIHEGQSFIVNRLDWEHGQAFVTPAHVDYYTEASTSTNVDVEEEHERVEARDDDQEPRRGAASRRRPPASARSSCTRTKRWAGARFNCRNKRCTPRPTGSASRRMWPIN